LNNNQIITALQSELYKEVKKVETHHPFAESFYQSLNHHPQSIKQKEHIEIKRFDEKWIRAIESYYQSLVRITTKLKSTLRYDEEVLPIEKTKKVDARTIRHLSSHTQYIRDIADNNDVMPSKVLSSQSEIDYGIYENRFIMTLINRLENFISDRLKIIKNDLEGKRNTNFDYQSHFEFDHKHYEIDLNIKQKETINKDKINNHNLSVYERAQYLYKMINNLKTSEFMRVMSAYKPVKPPIMKTQIILKNPDFKNAYLLWLFLDKFHKLDYSIDQQIINKRFSVDYKKQINQSILSLFSHFYVNDNNDLNSISKSKANIKSINAKDKPINDQTIEIVPYALEIEPQIISELFLEKLSNKFNQIQTEAIKEKPNTVIGLKYALKQMIEINNSLYAKFFEINQEKDVFHRLLNEDALDKRYDEANEKLKIAKIIREVKEKDYKDAVQLERKWQTMVLNEQKALIAQEKKELTQTLNDKIQKLKKETSQTIEMQKRETIKQKEIITRKYKDELAAYKKKLQVEYDNHKKKLKKREEERLKKEKLKLEQSYQKKLKLEKDKVLKEQTKLRKKLDEAKQKQTIAYQSKQSTLTEKTELSIKNKIASATKQESKKMDNTIRKLNNETDILKEKVKRHNQ